MTQLRYWSVRDLMSRRSADCLTVWAWGTVGPWCLGLFHFGAVGDRIVSWSAALWTHPELIPDSSSRKKKRFCMAIVSFCQGSLAVISWCIVVMVTDIVAGTSLLVSVTGFEDILDSTLSPWATWNWQLPLSRYY